MGIIEALFVLIIVGVVLWLVTTYIPMPQPFKVVIMVLGALFAIYMLLAALGFVSPRWRADATSTRSNLCQLDPGPRATLQLAA